MLQYFRNPLVCLVPVALLLSSCATTHLTSVWKDPSYQTRPARVLVIGVARNPVRAVRAVLDALMPSDREGRDNRIRESG